jgi:transcriptional regulator with XRE-family HTH domain
MNTLRQVNALEDALEPEDEAGWQDHELVQPKLGQALRRLREERRYSLAEVAAATGLSASFLAVVEKGRSDISIGRLMRVMHFYGARISDVFPQPAARDDLVVRRAEMKHIRSEAGVELYLLAQDTDRLMMPVLTEYAPHAQLANLESHDGETLIHILEGTILLEQEGLEPVVLSPGDTAYYHPNPAPRLTNLDDGPARLIGVVTPPTL